MGFAVYHIEKGKSNGASLGHHIDRTPGHEKSYKNANPDFKDQNVNYQVSNQYHKMPLNKAIKDRISKGYKGKRKIRNDAVTHLKHIMTFSHEDKVRFVNDKDLMINWIDANIDFIAKEYGGNNVLRFAVHMDEKTPHIHCVTVPLTKDGRLSAKEMMGDDVEMKAKQERYGEAMKPFGLDRGIRGSKAKHTSVDYFYGVLAKTEEKKKVNVTYPKIEIPARAITKSAMEEYQQKTEKAVKEHIDALKVDFEAKLKENLMFQSKDLLKSQRSDNLSREISDLKDSNKKMESRAILKSKSLDDQTKEVERLTEGLRNWKAATKAALTGNEEAKEDILKHLFQKKEPKKDNGIKP